MCVGVLEGYSHPYIFKAEKSRACVCARERERHTRARAARERERAPRAREGGNLCSLMISHPSPTALAHLKQTHSTQLRAHDAHTLQRYKINTDRVLLPSTPIPLAYRA